MMKNRIMLIAVMLMIALFAFAGASAEEIFSSEDGFLWILTGEETAEIVGYDGEVTGMLDIPFDVCDDNGDWYEVTTIAAGAFKGCGAESLYIGSNITEIGEEAFMGCKSLLEVSIYAEDLHWIPASCFEGCTALEDLDIGGELNSVGERAFYGCTSLSGLVLTSDSDGSNAVAYIDTSAFENCTSMEYVRLYNQWGEIGERAFYGCTGLIYVIFDDTTAFQEYAFANCTSLVDVLIPGRMDGGFYETSFEGCDNLTLRVRSGSYAEMSAQEYGIPYETIDLVDEETGLIYQIDEGMGCAVILGCTDAVSGKVVIPDELDGYEVVEIAFNAFYYEDDITEVIIPDTVLYIGSGAFAYSSVTSVQLPGLLEGVGAGTGMFAYCEDLTRVVMPEAMYEISKEMFLDCTSLTEVVMPGYVQVICPDAFAGCTSLEELIMPPSLIDIHESAFTNCDNLTLQVFSNTEGHWFADIFEIPYELLDQTDSATGLIYGVYADEAIILGYTDAVSGDLVIPSTIAGYPVTSISNDAFFEAPITSVVVSEGVTYIGFQAFAATPITRAVLPESLEDMQGGVFVLCDQLTDVTLPGNLGFLPYHTFCDCTALKEVTIPDGIFYIDFEAFLNCTALEKLYLPADMDYIDETALPDNENLTLYLWENSYAQDWADEYGFDYVIVGVAAPDASEYLVYDVTEDDEVIITGIDDAFEGELVIPDEIEGMLVSAIGESAFAGNTAITKVVVPEYCYWIGMSAFEDCTNLTDVVLPDDLNRIDGGAFEGCTSLKTINLPENLIVLGGSAFMECSALEEITLPPYLEEIADCTFAYCTGLKEITIPDGVTRLGYELFYGCTALEKAVVPASVITFSGSEVFADCPNVTLYVNTGSKAQEYADRYGIDYVLVDGEPEEEDPNATPAENFTYTLSGSGATITGFNYDYEGDIVIPATLGGEPVVAIGYEAFCDYYGGESITIPATVTSIGDRAFWCSGIYTLIFEGSECSFGYDLFDAPEWVFFRAPKDSDAIEYAIANDISYGCMADAPENGFEYMIGEYASYVTGYDGTPSGALVIPETLGGKPVRTIVENAFKGCTEITSVYIPDCVQDMYRSAFEGCTGLKSVRFPDGAMEMAKRVFYGCTSLEEVDLTNTSSEIYEESFYGCTSLKTVKMNIGCDDGGRAYSVYDSAFEGCTALEEVIFPENADWASIENRAFANCVNLTRFDAEGNAYIYEYYDEVFLNCAKLEVMYFAPYCWGLGEDIFAGCDSLTMIVYNNTSPMQYAVENDIPYVLRDSVTEDGLYYYINHSDAVVTGAAASWQGDTLVIPETIDGCPVVEIGENAFKGAGFKSVVLPETLRYVAYYAFADCTELTEVTLAATYYEGYCFSGCTSLKAAIFPEGTEDAIWEGMFENCTALERVHVPDSVECIGSEAFYGCTSLKEVTGCAGLSRIDERAFAGCSSLTSLFLPESLYDFSSDTFDGCDNLVLKVIEDSTAHNLCKSYSLAYELIGTSVENGIVYYTVNNAAYISGYTDDLPADLVIPSTLGGCAVRSIGERVFENAPVDSIVVSEGIERIDSYAFTGCTAQSVELPDSLTSMNYGVFSFCAELTEVNIPAGIKVLQSEMFEDCTSLEEIIIPEGITEIYSGAFSGCTALTSVTLPDNMEWISTYVFADCTSLESIDLPDSLTSIEDELFYGCTSLKEVVIPDGVDTLWYAAFADCPALEKVVIPESVTEIYDDVFEYSDNVVLYVYENSYAHTWAVKRDMAFELMTASEITGFAGVPDIIYLPSGVSFSLKLSALPEGTEMPEVAYRTDDASIVTVTADGVITTVGAGNACITITGGGATASMNVAVDEMPVMTLPKGTKVIDEESFAGSYSIRILDLRACDGVEIKANAFADNSKLRTVLLPANAVIDPTAFPESDMTVFIHAN